MWNDVTAHLEKLMPNCHFIHHLSSNTKGSLRACWRRRSQAYKRSVAGIPLATWLMKSKKSSAPRTDPSGKISHPEELWPRNDTNCVRSAGQFRIPCTLLSYLKTVPNLFDKLAWRTMSDGLRRSMKIASACVRSFITVVWECVNSRNCVTVKYTRRKPRCWSYWIAFRSRYSTLCLHVICLRVLHKVDLTILTYNC